MRYNTGMRESQLMRDEWEKSKLEYPNKDLLREKKEQEETTKYKILDELSEQIKQKCRKLKKTQSKNGVCVKKVKECLMRCNEMHTLKTKGNRRGTRTTIYNEHVVY